MEGGITSVSTVSLIPFPHFPQWTEHPDQKPGLRTQAIIQITALRPTNQPNSFEIQSVIRFVPIPSSAIKGYCVNRPGRTFSHAYTIPPPLYSLVRCELTHYIPVPIAYKQVHSRLETGTCTSHGLDPFYCQQNGRATSSSLFSTPPQQSCLTQWCICGGAFKVQAPRAMPRSPTWRSWI